MIGSLKSRWRKGKLYSVMFYTKKLKWKEQQFNHKFAPAMYFSELIGDKKEVSILDVGAGMFATVGTVWYGTTIKLTSCDILADEYNRVLKDNHITPILPVEKQDMENLTYPDNTFDIVHCVNALDHTLNPNMAIREMHRVCKKGGYIYFRHAFNMGKQRSYQGQHQYNMDIKDNDCFFWSNSYEKYFKLNEIIPGFVTRRRRDVGSEPEMIVSILHKT